MREIVPQLLWIGSASDARDWRRLMQQGVTAVVDLALEETAAQLPHEMVYCRFPLVDGDLNLLERGHYFPGFAGKVLAVAKAMQ